MKQGKQYIDLVWDKLEMWYAKLAQFTPNFVVGLAVFLFIFFSSKYFTRMLVQFVNRKFPNKTETIPSLIGFFRFLILLLGAFISLEIMGLSGFLWKFIGSLGVAGVIAGVALKDLVSSIFSGMLVGVDKSFQVGDFISLGNNSGTVQEIGFLTTKLLTEDGKKVYIPNQTIFSAPFQNISASPQRKVILDFQIPVGQDIERAKSAILEEITTFDYTDKTDASEVVFTDVKDGNFILQAKFWIETSANYIAAKSDAILNINKRLDRENICLVTPQSINIQRTDLQ